MFVISKSEDDPFFSAKLRLSRANDHLNNLISQTDKFFAEKPYTMLVELDPDGIHAIHKVQIFKRFPLEWYALATEIVEHMRTALDHATFVTRTKNITNYAAFPVGNTAVDLDNSVRGRSKDTPHEIQALLRGFDCYDGGNDVLYTLNILNNASKHGLVMLIAGATQSGKIRTTADGIAADIQIFDPLIWDSHKNEIPYARTKRGFNFDHDVEMKVYVAIQHTEGVSSIPATTIFDRILGECQRVVLAIEAESSRIGLFK